MLQNNTIQSVNGIQRKERDNQFDNIKGIMIFLVVLAHLLIKRAGSLTVIRLGYYYIYTFHMPVFIFIAGYFSKNTEKCRKTAAKHFLLPYMLFNTMYFLYKVIFGGASLTNYKITTPQWGMWFLLTMFILKIMAPEIKKLRFAFPIAMVLGLTIPIFPDFGSKMSLGRTAALLCFFTAGLLFKEEWILKLRKIPALAGCAMAVMTGIIVSLLVWLKKWTIKTVHLKDPYTEGEILSELIARAEYYILAFIMIIAIIIVIKGKKCFLSKIGRNSIAVYIGHLFLVRRITELKLFAGQPWMYIAFSVASAALITFILSRDVVRKAYDSLLNGICRLLRKN